MGSTELIQEKEAAEEHGEWNPEVQVGGDGTQDAAGTVSLFWRHGGLGIELLNLECHLRDRRVGSQSRRRLPGKGLMSAMWILQQLGCVAASMG